MKVTELMVNDTIEMLNQKQDKWIERIVNTDVIKSMDGLPEDKYYRSIKLTKDVFLNFYTAEVAVKENEYTLNNRLFIFLDGSFIDSQTYRKLNYVHELQNFMRVVEDIEIKKKK